MAHGLKRSDWDAMKKERDDFKARCTELEAAIKTVLDNSEWTSTDEGNDSHVLVERADYERLSALIEL